jgi:hypothetical protein
MSHISEMFALLGAADRVGHAFRFTAKDMLEHEPAKPPGEDGFSEVWQRQHIEELPNPPYPHRIYHDARTDCFMVLRPNESGDYWCERAGIIVRPAPASLGISRTVVDDTASWRRVR